MTEDTISRQAYCVTAKNDCEISAEKDGKTYVLLTLKAGQQGIFHAISDSVTCTDDDALILPFV